MKRNQNWDVHFRFYWVKNNICEKIEDEDCMSSLGVNWKSNLLCKTDIVEAPYRLFCPCYGLDFTQISYMILHVAHDCKGPSPEYYYQEIDVA